MVRVRTARSSPAAACAAIPARRGKPARRGRSPSRRGGGCGRGCRDTDARAPPRPAQARAAGGGVRAGCSSPRVALALPGDQPPAGHEQGGRVLDQRGERRDRPGEHRVVALPALPRAPFLGARACDHVHVPQREVCAAASSRNAHLRAVRTRSGPPPGPAGRSRAARPGKPRTAADVRDATGSRRRATAARRGCPRHARPPPRRDRARRSRHGGRPAPAVSRSASFPRGRGIQRPCSASASSRAATPPPRRFTFYTRARAQRSDHDPPEGLVALASGCPRRGGPSGSCGPPCAPGSPSSRARSPARTAARPRPRGPPAGAARPRAAPGSRPRPRPRAIRSSAPRNAACPHTDCSASSVWPCLPISRPSSGPLTSAQISSSRSVTSTLARRPSVRDHPPQDLPHALGRLVRPVEVLLRRLPSLEVRGRRRRASAARLLARRALLDHLELDVIDRDPRIAALQLLHRGPLRRARARPLGLGPPRARIVRVVRPTAYLSAAGASSCGEEEAVVSVASRRGPAVRQRGGCLRPPRLRRPPGTRAGGGETCAPRSPGRGSRSSS